MALISSNGSDTTGMAGMSGLLPAEDSPGEGKEEVVCETGLSPPGCNTHPAEALYVERTVICKRYEVLHSSRKSLNACLNRLRSKKNSQDFYLALRASRP